jgi:hypothetical protein
MPAMSGCVALTSIDLDGNKLTAEGLEPFCSNPPPNLTNLYMQSCGLQGTVMMGGGEEKEDPVVPKTPVAPVDPFPTSITGLSGRYDVGSATASAWNDKSSNANNAPVDRGTLKVTATDVTGTPADGLKFPTAVIGTGGAYTLLYVGKYNGATKGRIFDATTNNWLSTWWGKHVGVAHHNGWLTAHESGVLPNGSTELVQGTDSMGIYRLNGVDRKTAEPGAAKPAQITINSGQYSGQYGDETSDWAMKEVIFYNRVLTTAEITQVEKYLKDKYMSSGTETYTIGNDKEIEAFSF